MKKKVIISALDLYLIDKIRELRITANPHISQETLSLEISHTENFIESIENFSVTNFYSVRQLNLIANFFNMNISELFPEEAIKDDLLELEIEIIKMAHTNIQTDKYGNVLKDYRIINGRILKEEHNSAVN